MPMLRVVHLMITKALLRMMRLRVWAGMRSMMRLGSAWYDVESQITAVTEKGLDPATLFCVQMIAIQELWSMMAI